MRRHQDYLAAIGTLDRVVDAEERRALWRQSMATLAAAVADQRPVPLEGVNPAALQRAVRSAIATNLIDDLGFLSPPAAAAALYELAAAIPVGVERREIGRRILHRLHEGDAPTFVALATQIALGSRRALSGAPMRARVALSLDLPLGTGARADGLALALVSRRDVEREWLTLPSIGSLPSRRLAARLLERAAREAARRASQGDDTGLRVFEAETVRAAWGRLLADREPLVWRHVATARGLLSQCIAELGDSIVRDLDPSLSPTEWRRAAASLAARIAVAPDQAVARARAFLESDVVERDRGVAGAMALGLPRAAEAEPEAVEELLTTLVRRGGIDAAEALVDLRRERVGGDIGAWASELARAQLREAIDRGGVSDTGRLALMEALHAELAPETAGSAKTLPDQIAQALVTFATDGPRKAYAQARDTLDGADGAVGMLELSREEDDKGRANSFRALREIDLALLEKGTLSDLLMLGAKPDGTSPAAAALDGLFERLGAWLRAAESDVITQGGAVDDLTHRIHRMRALLHLADADEIRSEERAGALRERRLATAELLLSRAAKDAPTPLRRIVCAAAARACDALVRDEVCEVSDAFVAIVASARDPHDLATFAEATMMPEIEGPLLAYAKLGEVVDEAPRGGAGERACLDALARLAHALPVATSPRVEALRATLAGLGRALESIAAAGSLAELAEGTDGTLLAPLESAAHSLALIVNGAARRLGHESRDTPSSPAAVRLLDFSIERALRGNHDALRDALDATKDTMRAELLRNVARAAAHVMERIAHLPVTAPRKTRTSFVPVAFSEVPLPGWLPPGRMIGGFYVVRPLGAGAGGSVFVARRAEKRHDDEAEKFALKVPEYDGAAARTLSEAEFMTLFRQEAGALLSLPSHDNLAGFVTFDAGAHPKPILVMELVEGPTLQRVLEMRDLDAKRGLALLDGIAAGLEIMHEAEIGHLDVKPSNVILRDPDGVVGPTPPTAPVLVDFGLAGHHIRPGCGTGEYGSPEIWGALGLDYAGDPRPADVYAFGCLAFEVLTGRTLFEAPNEIALIATHLAHDGRPDPVRELGELPQGKALADVLSHALRHAPENRATIGAVRKGLAEIARDLSARAWPLA